MPTADELLSPATLTALADVLAEADPGGGSWPRLRAAADRFPALGLSERARLGRDAILGDLPGGYRQLADLTRAALDDPRLTGWMIWPLTEAIATAATTATAGTDGGDFEDGLELLAALTPMLTSEFALRTFLNADLDHTLWVVAGWTSHPDAAVRRLASEGTRPRLPWASQVPAIMARPAATVPVLDRLYTDDSDFVRRSVSNHLNDISRLDAGLALGTARRWAASPAPTTAGVVRHAMRTLIKAADVDALALVGFDTPRGALSVTGPLLRELRIPEEGEIFFDATITNTSDGEARVAIDYVIHYLKANGRTAPKVFKLSERRLGAGERIDIGRRHSFRTRSTRRHHPGPHAVELQVNGERYGRAEFILGTPAGADTP
ncbi:MAG TPA: DNA alkylation repair protein [Pseudonocardia sp.]|nr:DNA alkylation repair protein [Pseudonocardia sp.]